MFDFSYGKLALSTKQSEVLTVILCRTFLNSSSDCIILKLHFSKEVEDNNLSHRDLMHK